MEFRPSYGPEVYTGLVKIDGFLVGIIGNRQGFLPKGYPEYAPIRESAGSSIDKDSSR